jgi:large subunit ribosomal protein L18
MDKKPMEKKTARLRRARRARARIQEQRAFRLTVHRTSSHIYAQIIAPEGNKVVAAASTLEADIKKGLKYTGNTTAAQAVGKAIADKAKQAGITAVAFDRSGFRYHGRVKALADAAREHGLQF